MTPRDSVTQAPLYIALILFKLYRLQWKQLFRFLLQLPYMVPEVRKGLLHTLLAIPAGHCGSRTRQGDTHTCQHIFYISNTLRIIYALKSIRSGTMWHILCWCTMKPMKSHFKSGLFANGLLLKWKRQKQVWPIFDHICEFALKNSFHFTEKQTMYKDFFVVFNRLSNTLDTCPFFYSWELCSVDFSLGVWKCLNGLSVTMFSCLNTWWTNMKYYQKSAQHCANIAGYCTDIVEVLYI